MTLPFTLAYLLGSSLILLKFSHHVSLDNTWDRGAEKFLKVFLTLFALFGFGCFVTILSRIPGIIP